MKSRFSHIFRSLTITLVMAGFIAHLAQPFSSQAKKNAFALWLNQNVVASGNENETKLRDSIRQLPEQANDFWILVEQASRLVADYKDDFRIQFSFSDPGQRSVSSWLVGQWNVFENHKTGANAILPEFPQPLHKWLSSNPVHSVASPAADALKFSAPQYASVFTGNVLSPFLIPLASGISINAP